MSYPGYPPQGGQYPPQGGQYPPQGGQYPPQQGAYPPQGGFPPQGGYPPQQGGYPPQQGGYPPQQGGYPPQQGGYPPQGYPQAGVFVPPGSQGGARMFYVIKSRASGHVLDVEGNSRNPGARVLLWDKKREANDNQLWYDDPQTGTIRSKLNDFCLDVEGQLVLKPFQPGDPNQLLERTDILLRNRQLQNKVLEVVGNGAGALLAQRDYNGGINQQFEFEFQGGGQPYPQPGQPGGQPYGPGTFPTPAASTYPPMGQKREFHIVSQLHGKVLDIKGNDAGQNAEVIVWSKNPGNSKNQLWYADAQGHIRSSLNDMALFASPGQNIRMSPIGGDPRQQWFLDGQKISNRSGQCLDISGGNQSDGAHVISYDYRGSPNQHWSVAYVN